MGRDRPSETDRRFEPDKEQEEMNSPVGCNRDLQACHAPIGTESQSTRNLQPCLITLGLSLRLAGVSGFAPCSSLLQCQGINIHKPSGSNLGVAVIRIVLVFADYDTALAT